MNFIPDGLKRAIATKVARWLGTLAAGSIAGFILSHSQLLAVLNQACASLNSEDAMKAFGGALAVAGLALASSLKDAKTVNGKMAVASSASFDAGVARAQEIAAQAGADQQSVSDQAKVAAVAQAMRSADTASKQDRAAVVDALKKGEF